MSSQTQRTGPLSDSDVSIVARWFVETAISYLLYGVNVVISFTALYLLKSTSTRITRAQIGLFCLTILMLVMSTLSAFLTTAFILVEIPLNAINPPDVTSLLVDLNIVEIYAERLNCGEHGYYILTISL
ncbi:hypothetical protein K435DRAFT_802124 [Dendrothele bispora CBS 962.96]|uniref:G-protein coupled receptors family 1 profile domain-containing protein n=1 Tax=Dendrothele bispora (strain CBS 962.96) TaxID=1314807 RepID=A0A4S8LMR5_DENBC|nr:hypothetical protein K435DRAFT_802124 [Dendrothele bispora CBS 962.96]